MSSRRAVLLLVLAIAVAGASTATGNPPSVGQSIHVVRQDPRACPSPLCGGYWVARANHARTRCQDGLERSRCYVADAVGVDGDPLEAGLPDGALARAVIEPRAHGWFGELGVLVVADVRAPVGKGGRGAYYRVRDLGIRCVRAPCFHLRAARLNRPSRTIVSSLDLVSVARPSAKELARAEAAISTSTGLWLLGTIIEASEPGRILQASRFYLGSKS